MARYSNQQIFDAIHNGNEEILFYLSDRYFETGRRLLRRTGCKDSDTPIVFSKVLVLIYREIQQNKISPNIDLANFIFNSLKDYFKKIYSIGAPENPSIAEKEDEIIISCFSIMEESTRKILALRYVENLSFEQIASRLNFSNPFIAEFEFNKAFEQYENIAKARLVIPVEA